MKYLVNNFSGIFIFFGSLFAITVLTSQNVGINTTTPTKELDVNGDMAISGAIIPDGQTGNEGQVLQMQTGGNMAWVDLSKYENFKTFRALGGGSYTWSVPTGVTEVMGEIWSGGGTGNKGGGGGASAYVLCKIKVFSATSFSLKVGEGSKLNSVVIQTSKIAVGNDYVEAQPGTNAFTSIPGYGGIRGSLNPAQGRITYLEISGENGAPNSIRYDRMPNATYYKIINYGNGGCSPKRPLTGGKGGCTVENSFGNPVDDISGTPASIPGGGGGGSSSKTNGGDGMIILYW